MFVTAHCRNINNILKHELSRGFAENIFPPIDMHNAVLHDTFPPVLISDNFVILCNNQIPRLFLCWLVVI